MPTKSETKTGSKGKARATKTKAKAPRQLVAKPRPQKRKRNESGTKAPTRKRVATKAPERKLATLAQVSARKKAEAVERASKLQEQEDADKADGLKFKVWELHGEEEDGDGQWSEISQAKWRKHGTFESRTRANKKAWQVTELHYSEDEEDDAEDEDRAIATRLNYDGLFEETIYMPKKAPKGTAWTRVWVEEE